MRKKISSITIVVLWTLFFLAILGASFYLPIMLRINIIGNISYKLKTYYLAKAGVENALAELSFDESEGFDTLNDNWSYNIKAFNDKKIGDGQFSIVSYLDENTIKYGLIDEESKININRANIDTLKKIVRFAGKVSQDDAIGIAESIIDWRDEDDALAEHGAEDSFYTALDERNYNCKNKEFELKEELLLVKGVTQLIFDRLKYYITVYGEGKVNINTADSVVLSSLGLSDVILTNIIDFRKGLDGKICTQDDNYFESIDLIEKILVEKYNVKEADLSSLREIITKRKITVTSNYFSGLVLGYLSKGTIYGITKIFFIAGRDQMIKYWQESYEDGYPIGIEKKLSF